VSAGAFSARSAWDTSPITAPDVASTTTTRRIWCSAITRAHSSSDVSGFTVTAAAVIASPAVASSGFLPSASTRTTMSRSVSTPTGRGVSRLSTTGIAPQSCSTIIRATAPRPSSGVHTAGLLAMIS
jgi:hypothetical protein